MPQDSLFSGSKDIGAQRFLDDHWQIEPLVLRGALKGLEKLITPKKIFSLATEGDCGSRLVQRELKKGRKDPDQAPSYKWQVDFGPFSEGLKPKDFDSPAILLVNQVDSVVAAVAKLLKSVDFIPRWRVDDVMVSWANDHGSVGPHVDEYDVFLIQGAGQRRWCYETTRGNRDVLKGFDLSLLKEFTFQEDVILNTGDVLYLPSGFAHYGDSLGESINFSIGFRAPHSIDLLESLLEDESIVSFLRTRFRDGPLIATDPAASLAETSRKFRAMLDLLRLIPEAQLKDWIARYTAL